MHHEPDAIRIAFLADSAHYLDLAGVFNAWQARELLAEHRAIACLESATPRTQSGHQTVMWPS